MQDGAQSVRLSSLLGAKIETGEEEEQLFSDPFIVYADITVHQKDDISMGTCLKSSSTCAGVPAMVGVSYKDGKVWRQEDIGGTPVLVYLEKGRNSKDEEYEIALVLDLAGLRRLAKAERALEGDQIPADSQPK